MPDRSPSSAQSKTPGTPEVVSLGEVPAATELAAVARLLGGRIDTRHLVTVRHRVVRGGDQGLNFVFRFGVVVTIAAVVDDECLRRIDATLADHVIDPSPTTETESARLRVVPANGDRIGPQGQMLLAEPATPRLQLAATVLARSVVLARDETLVSEAFDRIAPLVTDLRVKGQVRLPIRPVMRLIGEVLSARHRMLAKVQADERPDLLWDNPELDRLYDRLEAEFELSERATVLARKFDALGDFAEVLLDLVQDKRAFRLEAAIIALIAFELGVSLFKFAVP